MKLIKEAQKHKQVQIMFFTDYELQYTWWSTVDMLYKNQPLAFYVRLSELYLSLSEFYVRPSGF